MECFGWWSRFTGRGRVSCAWFVADVVKLQKWHAQEEILVELNGDQEEENNGGYHEYQEAEELQFEDEEWKLEEEFQDELQDRSRPSKWADAYSSMALDCRDFMLFLFSISRFRLAFVSPPAPPGRVRGVATPGARAGAKFSMKIFPVVYWLYCMYISVMVTLLVVYTTVKYKREDGQTMQTWVAWCRFFASCEPAGGCKGGRLRGGGCERSRNRPEINGCARGHAGGSTRRQLEDDGEVQRVSNIVWYCKDLWICKAVPHVSWKINSKRKPPCWMLN